MATIETKAQLIAKMRESRAALEKVIAKVEPKALLQPGICGEWSGGRAGARGSLAATASRFGQLAEGRKPETPAPGYTWKKADVDRLNHQIYLEHRDQPLDEVLCYLRDTFEHSSWQRWKRQRKLICSNRFGPVCRQGHSG